MIMRSQQIVTFYYIASFIWVFCSSFSTHFAQYQLGKRPVLCVSFHLQYMLHTDQGRRVPRNHIIWMRIKQRKSSSERGKFYKDIETDFLGDLALMFRFSYPLSYLFLNKYIKIIKFMILCDLLYAFLCPLFLLEPIHSASSSSLNPFS